MGNTFLAKKLNYLTAKAYLVNKTIKMVRLPSELCPGIDGQVVVEDIKPGGTEDDLPTNVVYYICCDGKEIRVWDDDNMTIEILS